MKHSLLAFVATLLGVAILLFLDPSTLFLSALLLSILALRVPKKAEIFAHFSGIWFALSVSPALGVPLEETLNFFNGFLLQALLSFGLFIYFYTQKPSIIGRVYREAKAGVDVSVSAAIAGFASGILSAALWQGYLSLTPL